MAKHRIEKLLEKQNGRLTDRCGLVEDVLADAVISDDGVVETPVRLKVRTGDWLDHWWLGRIITDFDGMVWHKETLVLDWNHDANEEIGVIETRDHSKGDLYCDAKFISRDKSDRAAKIVDLARHQMPYEVSMTWGNPQNGKMEFEDLGKNDTAKVNGKTVHGPGTIIRKWGMYGAAVCPHGVDSSTTTTILDSERPKPMEKDLQKFIDAFGQDQAVKYFVDAEITSFEDAEKEHEKFLVAQQKEQLATLVADQEKAQNEIKALTEDRDKLKSEYEKLKTEFDKIKDAEKAWLEDKKKLESEVTSYKAALPGVVVSDNKKDSSDRKDSHSKTGAKGTFRDALKGFFGA